MFTFRRFGALIGKVALAATLMFGLATLPVTDQVTDGTVLETEEAEAWPWTPESIVYNQRGSYVPLLYAPNPYWNVKQWTRNSTQFTMICYVDGYWHTGNYRTNRWFYGKPWDTSSNSWVHASYVYYQKSVPRC